MKNGYKFSDWGKKKTGDDLDKRKGYQIKIIKLKVIKMKGRRVNYGECENELYDN